MHAHLHKVFVYCAGRTSIIILHATIVVYALFIATVVHFVQILEYIRSVCVYHRLIYTNKKPTTPNRFFLTKLISV